MHHRIVGCDLLRFLQLIQSGNVILRANIDGGIQEMGFEIVFIQLL